MAAPRMGIAFLDVCYGAHGARAACVLADAWEAHAPEARYVAPIAQVAPYEPGQFYRRELPCLLAVLQRLPTPPAVAVIDGYAWLPPGDRPGLGAHLHAALGKGTAVIGIAKTAYAGVETCPGILPVLRGRSRRPLFVSAVGMDPEAAARCVLRMAGPHRIPEMARLADRLARGSMPG